MKQAVKNSGSSENDIPSLVKRSYDNALRWFASELWGSVLSIASSGLGKGILMTAGLAMTGSILFGGGFIAGVMFLGSASGMAAIAIGGLAGGLIEASHHQSSSAQAERQAAHYARAREQNKAPQKALSAANDIAETNNKFCEAELRRRAEAKTPQRA